MSTQSSSSTVMITIFVIVFSFLTLLPLEAAGATNTTKPKPKFDILQILGGAGSFKTLIDLLNQTKLAEDINSRDTITLLAVDDGAIGDLSSKPLNRIKDILSTHVILDYYDSEKLQKLKRNTTVTTMYQASGVAENQQGFLKIAVLPNLGTEIIDKLRIGSAAKGAPFDVQLTSDKEVDYKKFDYVVHSISGVIFTPGIDGMTPPPTRSPIRPPHITNTTTASPAPGPDVADDYDDVATPDGAPPATAPAPSPSESKEAPAADDDDKSSATPPKSSSGTKISLTFFTTLVVVVVSSFAYAVL